MNYSEPAIRNGDIYCAPWCGRGCTHAEYELAVKNSLKLERALGPGWKAHVWENLGWHFSVNKGEHTVHQTAAKRYWASLVFGGKQFTCSASTPEAAVRTAFVGAQAFAISFNNDIVDFQK